MLGLALAKAKNSSGSGCFLGFSPNQFQFYIVFYLVFSLSLSLCVYLCLSVSLSLSLRILYKIPDILKSGYYFGFLVNDSEGFSRILMDSKGL